MVALRKRADHTTGHSEKGSDVEQKATSNITAEELRQRQMLQQMRAQNRREHAERQLLQDHQDQALGDQIRGHLKTLLLIIVIGFGGILYVDPHLTVFFGRKRPKMPPRRIMAVYPKEFHIFDDLPRFSQNYALATPENEKARKAVQKMAHLRKWATNPGLLNQNIRLHAWEHDDFNLQAPGQRADQICGIGFRDLYSASPEFLQTALLQWCLLYTGHHDGYVDYKGISQLEAALTRGIQGTVVIFDDDENNRMIDTTSILLLPILNITSKTQVAMQPEQPPSTLLPPKALHWLAENGVNYTASSPRLFDEAFGRFLYREIELEKSSWVFLRAACDDSTIDQFQSQYRSIGQTCKGHETKCCTIFDPHLPAFRSRRHDDD